jgi:GTP cyclohydrolase I
MGHEDYQLEATNGHSENDETSASPIDHEKARRATRLLLEAIGEDPERDGLEATWARRVPDVFETLSEGKREDAKPTMRTFESDSQELVIKTGIPVFSLCEHHLLPYHGVAHVAYRPEGAVVGLSKLPRYVRWQSRRLTMQEELTRDLALGLAEEIDTDSVIVEMTATHLCEAMRGIETATETTTRASTDGVTSEERARFEDAIRRNQINQ